MVWSGHRSGAKFRAPASRLVGDELLGPEGMSGDGLASVDQVQVAAFDRGLRFEVARATPGRGQDVRTVLDHAERPDRALELGHEIVADRLRASRTGPGTSFVTVALQCIGSVGHGLIDRLWSGLLVADRIDLARSRAEERINPNGQVPHGALEVLDLSSPGGDAARSAKDDRETGGQGDEGHDRQQDQELLHAWCLCAAAQPDRARSCSMSAEQTSNRSPTTSRSAKSAIGASGSRLTATIVPAVCIPTLCWIAPLMPRAR